MKVVYGFITFILFIFLPLRSFHFYLRKFEKENISLEELRSIIINDSDTLKKFFRL